MESGVAWLGLVVCKHAPTTPPHATAFRCCWAYLAYRSAHLAGLSGEDAAARVAVACMHASPPIARSWCAAQQMILNNQAIEATCATKVARPNQAWAPHTKSPDTMSPWMNKLGALANVVARHPWLIVYMSLAHRCMAAQNGKGGYGKERAET